MAVAIDFDLAGGFGEAAGESLLELFGFEGELAAGGGELGDILLEAVDPALGLGQLVEHGDAGHDGQAGVADLAETRP